MVTVDLREKRLRADRNPKQAVSLFRVKNVVLQEAALRRGCCSTSLEWLWLHVSLAVYVQRNLKYSRTNGRLIQLAWDIAGNREVCFYVC
jgi:hypothetical protein